MAPADIGSVPVGGDGGKADLSVSGGMVIASIVYPVEKILDSALIGLEAKYPSLKPEIEILKAAIDAQLGQA